MAGSKGGKEHKAREKRMHYKRKHSLASGQAKKVKRACNPYISPAAGDKVVAYQETLIKWDPSCISFPEMDIYLQSIDASEPIHLWKSVPSSSTSSSLSTSFSPIWWNSTSGLTSLQLLITGSGQPSWAGLQPGPVFYGSFDGVIPAANASASATGSALGASYTGPSVEIISAAKETDHSLTGGRLAAAVLFPLLAVVGAVAGYIFYSRRKSSTESKRWSAYVDQRMSMVSNTWQPQTGGHARNGSNATFGQRPGSTLSNAAGIGVPRAPEMAQRDPYRNSVASATQRQSRVSFALDNGGRKSADRSSRNLSHLNLSGGTRSHLSSRLGMGGGDKNSDLVLSPDQENGPRVVDESKLAKQLGLGKREVAGVRPGMNRSVSSHLRYEIGEGDEETRGAVKMIWDEDQLEHDRLQEELASNVGHAVSSLERPQPALRSDSLDSLAAGPASGMRRLSKVRTSTMSPDEALRQYTLARRNPASPPPGNGMRVLYSPPAVTVKSESARSSESRSQGLDAEVEADDLAEHEHAIISRAGRTSFAPGLYARTINGASMYSEGSRYSRDSGGEGVPEVPALDSRGYGYAS